MAPILKIIGVSKDFAGLKALHDVDVQIQEGEILGVIGPNGSGKTTLTNVVTGFLPPTAGSVVYKESLISGLPPEIIAAKGIARTFQITSIFPNLTVEDNVIAASYLRTSGSLWGAFLHTKAYRREEAKLRQQSIESLTLLGLQGKGSAPANTLGLAEQRRLEIALALAIAPKLLLLDEPAAGLNVTEALELVHLLKSIHRKEITLVVIEHNMKVIMQLCSRIVVLNYGVKIAEGTPEEIAKNDEVISVYLGGELESA